VRSRFVPDVYFWTDPYMGREVFLALCLSVRAAVAETNGERRTRGTGTGPGNRQKGAHQNANDTNLLCTAANSQHILIYCTC